MGHDEAVVTQISVKAPIFGKESSNSCIRQAICCNIPTCWWFPAPFMPLMVNPLNAEPAKSVNSKDNSFNKKLKEIDGTAVSTGSGNSEKTSGDYSLEGSSDGTNQMACGTPKKRSLDDMTTSGLDFVLQVWKKCGASIPNDKTREPGRLATVTNVRIADTVIKIMCEHWK
ncbi:hypothetical protein PR202_ga10254 [Eleusine coracana subsp. coracana]|uniref:Uncharacterized protein n=1 Tax=Eleusine coracana subsp. coracana TaxID=191504 RepID=A0AAV5C674_ELECO|nr:hypothetical protein PR202_ga10254 [Eleusine coracana subsp. coracana]